MTKLMPKSMNRPIFLRNLTLATLGVLMPVAICAAAPKPQDSSQTESVADAARKAREQKAKDTGKPAKVYTDDDVSDLKGTISVVGPASDADAAKTADTQSAADKAPSDKNGGEAYWRGKFADARKALSEDARELDIEQREFNLKQTQYYSDPNVALREQNDRKDLNDTQAKIDELKAKVDKDKQAIADLEEQLRKAGGDPSWAQDNAQLPVPAQPPSDGQPANPAQAQPPNTPASDTPAPSDVQPTSGGPAPSADQTN
jgi:hypothetical protein